MRESREKETRGGQKTNVVPNKKNIVKFKNEMIKNDNVQINPPAKFSD